MPVKLTAIIVDNEKDARDGLEKLIINKVPEIEVINKAANAPDALALVIDKHPDLLFLDIQMPLYNGFWLADKLKNFENGTGIIFITAYDEYAIEAIKHAAFDFLTKPVSSEELGKAVYRFMTNKDKEKEKVSEKLSLLSDFFSKTKIKLHTQTGFIMVKPEDIIYCEANGNYCNIYLTNGKKELISLQLGIVEEKLPKDNFLRINRSVTINLDYLDSFNRKTMTVRLANVLQKYDFHTSRSGARKLMRL